PYPRGLLPRTPGRAQRKAHGLRDTPPAFLPTPGDEPAGCIFAPRCPIAEDQCRAAPPPPFPVGNGRTSRCYLYEQTEDLPRNTPVNLEIPPVRDAGPPVVRLARLSKTFG